MNCLDTIAEDFSTSAIIYNISCLLSDIDLVIERLDAHFLPSDVSKVKDLVDDLLSLVDLLNEEFEDSVDEVPPLEEFVHHHQPDDHPHQD